MTNFAFTPSNLTAPQFTPTLDGDVYTCTVTWNLFGQRYFVNCFDNQNNPVFSVPLVTSPKAKEISGLSWDAASLRAYVETKNPHGFRVGSVVVLTLGGTTPSGYNGEYECYITSSNTFFYSLNQDPGQLVTLGVASFQVSLTKGYFNSTMVYRNGQFEVNP